jgi:hypothetical protein
MPRRRNETVIAEFLRDALARDDVGVPKLESMARTAGLLGEDQRITHAKPFKAAKKALGITSRRLGFGPRSQWLWRLPRQNKTSVNPERAVERRAAPERRVSIPIDWVDGVASLDDRHPPSDIPRHRWRQLVGDCRTFLSSSDHWAERAARLGWDAMALFGCAPKRPLDYLGSAGLLWAINGGKLVELHRDWAVIDVPLQTRQRLGSDRRPPPDKAAHFFPPECGSGEDHFALVPARWLEAVRSACAAGASQSRPSPDAIDVPCRRVSRQLDPNRGKGSP